MIWSKLFDFPRMAMGVRSAEKERIRRRRLARALFKKGSRPGGHQIRAGQIDKGRYVAIRKIPPR